MRTLFDLLAKTGKKRNRSATDGDVAGAAGACPRTRLAPSAEGGPEGDPTGECSPTDDETRVAIAPEREQARIAASNQVSRLASASMRNGKLPKMQERYQDLVRDMKARYRIRIVRWRTSMSGAAWQVMYRDGTTSNLIEAPYPKGPMSAAIFMHEVGHHAIGLHCHKPRCLEELYAWQWALRTMEERGITITDRVRKRMDESMRYAVAKARRRGLKRLPTPLLPYL